jgi:hypothetical protein
MTSTDQRPANGAQPPEPRQGDDLAARARLVRAEQRAVSAPRGRGSAWTRLGPLSGEAQRELRDLFRLAAEASAPCLDYERSSWWSSEDLDERLNAAALCHGCAAMYVCRRVGHHMTWGVWGGLVRYPRRRPVGAASSGGGGQRRAAVEIPETLPAEAAEGVPGTAALAQESRGSSDATREDAACLTPGLTTGAETGPDPDESTTSQPQPAPRPVDARNPRAGLVLALRRRCETHGAEPGVPCFRDPQTGVRGVCGGRLAHRPLTEAHRDSAANRRDRP